MTLDAGGSTITTPGQVELKRDHGHLALVEKDGYASTTVTLNRDVSMDVFMNFVCVGVFAICFAVDFLTGDAFELKPDPVSVTLVAAPSAVAPAPAAPTEAPTRGTPPTQ
ncbi:MAG TPA: hypothetical protein VK714_00480 [Myxococcota bacterium]|nr:hypothetical protein [Myxococcota bacterium]